jgi:hypothetical protein
MKYDTTDLFNTSFHVTKNNTKWKQYATTNFQQNSIPLTQFLKDSSKSIHQREFVSCRQNDRQMDKRKTTGKQWTVRQTYNSPHVQLLLLAMFSAQELPPPSNLTLPQLSYA